MRLLLIILLALAAAPATAKDKKDQPKPLRTLIKDARTAIKNAKGQGDAEKRLLEALARPALKRRDSLDILFLCAELQQSVNAGENMKAYLKQKYDTTLFFASILAAYRYVIRTDSLDALQAKPVYQQKGRDLMARHRPNLLAGGKWLIRHNKPKEAYPYLDTYLHTIGRTRITDPDSVRYRTEYWATYAAYHGQLNAEVLQHIDTAIVGARADTTRMALMEIRALTYERLADHAHYIQALHDGNHAYPADNYFFLHLIDDIQERKAYREGIDLADQQLMRVGPRAEYYLAKSIMYLRLDCDDPAIVMADSTLALAPDNAEALYNKGTAYIHKAVRYAETACTDLRRPECRRDRDTIISLYRHALTPMQRLRTLQPDNPDRWGRPLYRIYLYLNMGKEFDEIDRLLNK